MSDPFNIEIKPPCTLTAVLSLQANSTYYVSSTYDVRSDASTTSASIFTGTSDYYTSAYCTTVTQAITNIADGSAVTDADITFSTSTGSLSITYGDIVTYYGLRITVTGDSTATMTVDIFFTV